MGRKVSGLAKRWISSVVHQPLHPLHRESVHQEQYTRSLHIVQWCNTKLNTQLHILRSCQQLRLKQKIPSASFSRSFEDFRAARRGLDRPWAQLPPAGRGRMVVLYQLNCQRVGFRHFHTNHHHPHHQHQDHPHPHHGQHHHHHHHQPILSPRWFSRCLERSTFFFHSRNGLPVGGIVTTLRCTGAVYMSVTVINLITI